MSCFQFKYFTIVQESSAMKVGTDALLLGSLVAREGSSSYLTALDIGTGTGVISLMLVQRFPELRIDAIDIDAESANEASFNFSRSKWSERLSAVHCSLNEWQPTGKYSLIVSNPPFFSSNNPGSDARRAAARHLESLSKAEFVSNSSRLLEDQGELWIIVPFIDNQLWIEEMESKGLYLFKQVNIRGKEDGTYVRSVLSFCFEKKNTSTSDFVVRKLNGSYTDQYVELTSEYHDRDLSGS